MSQQHSSSSGTFATLVTGAVFGAAGLAWWLLNEADRRRRANQHQAMQFTVGLAASAFGGGQQLVKQLSLDPP